MRDWNSTYAPISTKAREKLRTDLEAIHATAKRKGLDDYGLMNEQRVGREHFELGCWLWYYSTRLNASISSRIDCARRIFMAGIANPRYDFYTVFDFGERQFDGIMEMGDGRQVVDGLRQFLANDPHGCLAKAFCYHGWPLEQKDQVFDLTAQ